jgi:hypothetical protein
MSNQYQQERPEIGRYKKSKRPSGLNIIIATALTILIALAAVLGVQAIGDASLGWRNDDHVLKVPLEYPTIQAAIQAAEPGDIIEVQQGEYFENLVLDKPVTLVASTFDEIDPARNTTVIDGANNGPAILIPAGLPQMPTIRGFVIRNGTDNILASSGFIAEFNYFHSADNLVSYQMGGGGSNRNNVYFGARNNAIRLNNMNSPLTIENNRIMYSGGTGIEISLEPATAPPATTEIGIWNNMIIGNSEDGVQFVDHPGQPQNTNRRFVIAGNLIANNRMAGVGLLANANSIENYSAANITEAVRVFNNTLYGNDYGISGGGNLVAFNNIITNSLTRGTWMLETVQTPDTLVALGTPEQANSVLAYSLLFNNLVDTDRTNVGTGVILGVDPFFEAVPNAGPDGAWATVDDDFSGLVLRSDSQAIDRGVTQLRTNNGEFVPPVPISGFIGAAPDLGWREFGAPIFSTPTPTPISSSTPLPTEVIGVSPSAPTNTSAPASLTPEPATQTPGAQPTVTVVPPTTTATSIAAPLTVTGIDPVSAQADSMLFMTIVGTGFQTGTLVTFELDGVVLQQEVLNIQVINDTTIFLLMIPRNDGNSAQIWDVRVTNPDLTTFVLQDALTVTPAP